MTQDEIIRMAREAGKTKWYGTHPDGTNDFLGAEFTPEQLERFAALVAAHEREACAQTVETESQDSTRYEFAAAIRARSV